MEPTFEQPSTAMAPKIETGDPEYQRQAMAGYQQQVAPNYRGALKKLRQGYASRGLADSGMAGLAELGLTQSHLQDVNDFSRQGALRAADKAEENRRASQMRGWQVEDRDFQYKNYKNMQDLLNQRADAARASQMISGLFGTVGSAVGSYYGGSKGGESGGNLGNSLGQAVSGGGNSR